MSSVKPAYIKFIQPGFFQADCLFKFCHKSVHVDAALWPVATVRQVKSSENVAGFAVT
jgi:hypothetical protein